jgi:hypothetical protein
LLIDIDHAGNTMINGIRNRDELIKEYEELEQYIFSFAKDFVLEDLIEYDDYVFWQELAGNLARV